jgi:phage-related minor tail protein
VNEVKVTVKAEGKGLDNVEAEAKQTGAKVGRELEKGFKDGEQAGEKASKKMQGDLDRTAKESGKAGSKIGESLSKGVEGGFEAGAGAVKAGVLGLAATIGGTLLAGVQQQFQETKIGGMISAQTGAAADSAGKLGQVVGDTFGDNFGDSMEQVQQALTDVVQTKLIDTDATAADLQKVTEQAITASQVVGEETKAIGRAARQMIVNGLAGSVTEAMDIIVHAQQEGLNVNDDLIDTIVEYGTKFRDLGISGPEAMGLISQAMEAGARDTDFAADALKEFSIRAVDGSEATARGFRSIGLDAGQMGDAIAAGGTRAHGALKLTLDGLRGIHDPVMRNQAAVDLFGTKAEDLGRALFNMDLDTAAAKFGEFQKATQKAADEISKTTPAIEVAWRHLSQAPGDVLEWATQSEGIDEAMKKFKEYTRAKEQGAGADAGFADRVKDAEDAVRRSSEAIDENTRTLEENIKASSKMADGVLSLWDAENGHAEALEKAKESLKDNGKTLDFHTEKGRANRDALSDLAKSTFDQIEAMEKQGATAADIQPVIAAQRDEFVGLATKMGLSAAEAQTLANKLGLIPGNYRANVYADTSQANAAIQNTQGLLAMLRDKTIRLSVQETRFISKEAQFGAFKASGGIVGAAGGGPRSGRTLVGEYGPEILDIAPGSQVHSNPDSQRMMSEMAGAGRPGPTRLEVHVLGDTNQWLVKAILQAKRDGLLDLLVS